MPGSHHGKDRSPAASLPVTALHIVNYNKESLLLAGTGSFLSLYHISSSNSLLFAARIFSSQSIHGIVNVDVKHYESSFVIRVLVWGGKLLTYCDLSVAESSSESGEFNIEIGQVRSTELEDWILHITVLPLVCEAVVLTAHNNLWKLSLSEDCLLQCAIIANGPQTLLYSGHVIASEKSHLLIASGSVFGEIMVWLCLQDQDTAKWITQTRHIFLGHRGSIFGVTFSNRLIVHGHSYRLLASCSDDRTVRVWDVSDCDVRERDRDHSQLVSQVTGFGEAHEDTQSMAMAWGHLSRIWNVTFVQAGVFEHEEQISLLSRGEDGACHYWTLNKSAVLSHNGKEPLELVPIFNDHHHAGKNAWSWARMVFNDQCLLITGGADGQIIRRTLPTPAKMFQQEPKSITFKQLLENLQQMSEKASNSFTITSKALKQYLIFENGLIIASTDDGHLVGSDIKQFAKWSIIEMGNPETTITLSTGRFNNLAFVGRADGRLAVFDALSRQVSDTGITLQGQASSIIVANSPDVGPAAKKVITLVINTFGDCPPRLLFLSSVGSINLIQTVDLLTPLDFIITSASYSTPQATLICGSRSGAVVVFDDVAPDQNTREPAICVRHVHGSDCVTSVMQIQSDQSICNYDQLILTTGRDGTYAVHCFQKSEVDKQAVLLTLHRSTPPLGPCIEGGYFQRSTQGRLSLILYGFKSTDFVIWDETWQKLLHSVDCGGAHRSWYFDHDCASDNIMSFIWNKAGTVKLYRNQETACLIVQEGGHGREIKALAISPNDYGQGCPVVATGAEDTDIRLSSASMQPQHLRDGTSLHCLRVLKGHTAGIQHLRFSSCGGYLFSSAGREEMCVWKITTVPIIDIGTVLIAWLPKVAEDSDARIMSFDVVEDNVNSEEFLLSMAYSNGKVKMFTFSKQKAELKFLQEHIIGPLCLSQAANLDHERIVIGATDGYLRVVDLSYGAVKVSKQLVHQSNIASIDVRRLDTTKTLVVSGGDDNALGVTVIQDADHEQFETLLIPSAHAAAITAVTVVNLSTSSNTIYSVIASVGNDQKVRTWKIEVPLQNNPRERYEGQLQGDSLPQGVKLTKLRNTWTDVADVSDVGVLVPQRSMENNSIKHQKNSLLVVGVGMQVISID